MTDLQKLILQSQEIMLWWKNAQFWEAYPGCNMFDDDPPFVESARKVVEQYGKEPI